MGHCLVVLALMVYVYTHYYGSSSMVKGMQTMRSVACQSYFGIGDDNVAALEAQWSINVGVCTGPLTFQIGLRQLGGPVLDTC